jgi:hypothetical protein
MDRDQVLLALRDKLRELDVDDGIVGVICVNEQQSGSKVAGFQTKTNFYALQCAQIVLDLAAAFKARIGSL